jgi:magnesium-transporting ATPase (P-type)
MASEGLKPIAFAYKSMSCEYFEDRLREWGAESEYFYDELMLDLIYIGTVGLEDELNDNIQQTVSMIRYGKVVTDIEAEEITEQVTVRLVSGDHPVTCSEVAVQTGIIKRSQIPEENGYCLSGEAFMREIGGVNKDWDPMTGHYKYSLANPSSFRKVAEKLRVLSRATPEHKLALVVGIKEI